MHPASRPPGGEGFHRDAFAQLAQVEAGNYWFESRNRLILWALGRHFPGARSFLEIGCGTGFVLRAVRDAFPDLELAGAELFDEGLRIARARVPEAAFFAADARTFRPVRQYDVVGAFDVLEHIDDDEAALRGMAAAVAPGGGLLVTVPQHPRLWSQADTYACHVRRYERSTLLARMTAAGFAIRRVTSFVSVLLPLMALSRLRNRRGPYDPLAEMRVSGPVNATLRLALDAERALIRGGVSWPWGGSLLVVARRFT